MDTKPKHNILHFRAPPDVLEYIGDIKDSGRNASVFMVEAIRKEIRRLTKRKQ